MMQAFSSLIIEKITFSVDDVETGAIKAGSGLWSRGGFDINAPGKTKGKRIH